MDPYIEGQGYWSEFHVQLIGAVVSALNRRLPPGYAAGGEMYVWVHEPEVRTRLGVPDIYVSGGPARGPAVGRAQTAPAATGRLTVLREQRHRYVKITDLKRRRVVTAVELLSPVNKAADGRDAYLSKRQEFLAAGTSLIEIDLLRGGGRLALDEPPAGSGVYTVMVARTWRLPDVDLWFPGLREPLPEIPVPLAEGEPEPTLPLQECVDRVYEETRMADKLDYAGPLAPPLPETDAAWAAARVAPPAR
jgi:hypothetical protein